MLFSKAERRYITENCHIHKDQEIAAKLSAMNGFTIDIDSIRRFRQRAGLKKLPGRGINSLIGETPLSPHK